VFDKFLLKLSQKNNNAIPGSGATIFFGLPAPLLGGTGAGAGSGCSTTGGSSSSFSGSGAVFPPFLAPRRPTGLAAGSGFLASSFFSASTGGAVFAGLAGISLDSLASSAKKSMHKLKN